MISEEKISKEIKIDDIIILMSLDDTVKNQIKFTDMYQRKVI